MKGDRGKWQVKVNWVDFEMRLDVYIVRFIEDEAIEYISKLEGDLTTMERVGINSRIKPTFTLFRGHSDEIMKAFADVCEKNGFRPEGKPVLENELTATKYHLEDMRKLALKL